ncbi:MAG: glucosaminidase domain-containing protein, partial [Streptosporangiales bacterium]
MLPSAGKPWWQQATAVVSLSAGGAVTGFSFAPKATVDITSPSSLPISLLALGHTVRQGQQAPADDSALRSAIVTVANYYLQMAKDKTPAEMEAIIWQQDSLDGADHGPSCGAFASMTLELAAQVVGGQSWVTGGSSYPWPLHTWADVRVDPNPASPGITSILQDAEAHQRWHPLGDGYRPMPGDWVLFDQHVEVVTGDSGGVLHTIGGDSLPNFSVNAHQYPGPLAAQGVAGFVNNGAVATAGETAAPSGGGTAQAQQADTAPSSGSGTARASQQGGASRPGSAVQLAAIPGSQEGPPPETRPASPPGTAAIPGTRVPAPRPAQDGTPSAARAAPAAEDARARSLAWIPGVQAAPQQGSAARQAPYRRHQPEPAVPAANDTSTRQAFISAVAPGAIAAQRKYGVPAAVTIAQAIEESGWGQSSLAVKDNNLFGIKGTGPAGSDDLPTQEYLNGQWVSQTAAFRVYDSVAQSIDDHGKLLATSGYYTRAMAARRSPNAFAAALTGVYATDPTYGTTLIGLMRQYNLYRYDAGVASSPSVSAAPAARAGVPALAAEIPGAAWAGTAGSSGHPRAAAPASTATASPRPTASAHATTS